VIFQGKSIPYGKRSHQKSFKSQKTGYFRIEIPGSFQLKSGWLESYGTGAFKRPNENVRWTGAVNSIQRQTELPVHVGGLTSPSLQGLSHYLRMEKEPLSVFTTIR
jgi:hypothetical protein